MDPDDTPARGGSLDATAPDSAAPHAKTTPHANATDSLPIRFTIRFTIRFQNARAAGSIPSRGCIIAIAEGARQADAPPCCRSATARMQRLQPVHIASMFCTRTPMGTQLVNSNTIPA